MRLCLQKHLKFRTNSTSLFFPLHSLSISHWGGSKVHFRWLNLWCCLFRCSAISISIICVKQTKEKHGSVWSASPPSLFSMSVVLCEETHSHREHNLSSCPPYIENGHMSVYLTVLQRCFVSCSWTLFVDNCYWCGDSLQMPSRI